MLLLSLCTVFISAVDREEFLMEISIPKSRLPRISKDLGNKEQQAEACDFQGKSYCKEGNDQGSRRYTTELPPSARNSKQKHVIFKESRIVKKGMIKEAEDTQQSCPVSARNSKPKHVIFKESRVVKKGMIKEAEDTQQSCHAAARKRKPKRLGL